MKDLKTYILEAKEDDEDITSSENDEETSDEDTSGEDTSDEDTSDESDEKTTERGNIKYTIWLEPDKKVTWLKPNQKFQKIEYKHKDRDKNIFIDFLLGYVENQKTWKLWIGKIGSLSYDDDPYCDLETDKFSEAIVKSLDKTQEFIADVEDDPQNWIQYYKDI